MLRELEARAAGRRRRRTVGIGVVALAAAVVVVLFRPPAAEPMGMDLVASAVVVRQPERQVLTDGSVVELRDQARISAEFSDTLRRLVLEAGEAHFQVAKNPDRPFVVEAGPVRVRAVGTAFTVRPDAAWVEVIVTEGRVAVGAEGSEADAAGNPAPVQVDAGARATIDSRTGAIVVSPLAEEQVAGELAWRVPRLEFSGTPLREVVAAFNEHNELRLVLADRPTGDLRLSGIIRADNVDALLALLESSHGIQADRRDGIVTLRRARW